MPFNGTVTEWSIVRPVSRVWLVGSKIKKIIREMWHLDRVVYCTTRFTGSVHGFENKKIIREMWHLDRVVYCTSLQNFGSWVRIPQVPNCDDWLKGVWYVMSVYCTTRETGSVRGFESHRCLTVMIDGKVRFLSLIVKIYVLCIYPKR